MPLAPHHVELRLLLRIMIRIVCEQTASIVSVLNVRFRVRGFDAFRCLASKRSAAVTFGFNNLPRVVDLDLKRRWPCESLQA